MYRTLTLEEAMRDLRLSLRGLVRAPVMALADRRDGGPRHRRDDRDLRGDRRGAAAAPPYRDPARLVRIYTDSPPNRFRFSVADYLALQKAADALRADRRLHEP